jgi:uncharacterized protein YdgA (DUF945 family)
MKKTLAAIVILILCYPLGSWIIGVAVERHIDQLADRGQAMLPTLHRVASNRRGLLTSEVDSRYEAGPQLQITRHFHRGWFSSADEVHVELRGPAALHTPLRLSLQTTIHHGPICATAVFALACAETHIRAPSPLQAQLTRIFGNSEPLTIHSQLAFLGGGSGTLLSPAVTQARLSNGTTVDWGGLTATFHDGAAQDWYDLAARAPSLSFANDKAVLQMQAMELNMHARRALGAMYVGDSLLRLKHLSASAPDQSRRVSLEDLVFGNRSQMEDRFMSVSYQLGAGAISTQSLTLTGAHVDLSWKHLSLAALQALLEAMRSAGQPDESVAPAARAGNLLAAIRQPLQALLLDQPEMDIDRLSAVSAKGQAMVSGVIRLPGATPADLDVPLLLLQKLDARIELSVDEAFLATLPGAAANGLAQLQPLIDQGYLTRANGALHTQFVFHGGLPTLNGKPVNPSMMRPSAAPPATLPAPQRPAARGR